MPSWQTDRAKLNEVLMKPPVMQVRAILAKFKELNKQTDLATAISQAQFRDQDMIRGYMYLSNYSTILFVSKNLEICREYAITRARFSS